MVTDCLTDRLVSESILTVNVKFDGDGDGGRDVTCNRLISTNGDGDSTPSTEGFLDSYIVLGRNFSTGTDMDSDPLRRFSPMATVPILGQISVPGIRIRLWWK